MMQSDTECSDPFAVVWVWKLQILVWYVIQRLCECSLLDFDFSSNQVKDQGGRVAGSPTRLQQDLEGAEREVLPQVSRPSRHQLQTEWHQSASIQVPAEWNRKHLWWGTFISPVRHYSTTAKTKYGIKPQFIICRRQHFVSVIMSCFCQTFVKLYQIWTNRIL